ncbi:MAG: hypothetical protein C0601_08935 [Candidatus Muiribacterium halophilum]|uniref:Uncharacterized protein n=1 Tax=Muiribacterium halophilum TaxID=2053465 RepID=A0A2N5ZE08_MUIH1|nr:MAG: hypothetical protein C0601_08935 [Candidatus Muirbacterium halophilum]
MRNKFSRNLFLFVIIISLFLSVGCGKRTIDLDSEVLVKISDFNVGMLLSTLRGFHREKPFEGPVPLGNNETLKEEDSIIIVVLKAQNVSDKEVDKSFFNDQINLISPDGKVIEETLVNKEFMDQTHFITQASGKIAPKGWFGIEKLFPVKTDSIKNEDGWKLKVADQYYRLDYELLKRSMDYLNKSIKKK